MCGFVVIFGNSGLGVDVFVWCCECCGWVLEVIRHRGLDD